MKKTFAKLPWWAILALMGLILTGLVRCGDGRSQSLAEPASDRPTFVWIFSDP